MMLLDTDANVVYLSPWLKAEYTDVYAGLIRILYENAVDYSLIPDTADLWCRDYMPVQIGIDDFVCYRYWPDYLLRRKSDVRYITDTRQVCRALGLTCRYSDIIIDGGNVVKTGNHVIMTEKVFAENPIFSRDELLDRLTELFGCPIVFLPWDRLEIYGHADGLVKPISPDTVLLTNYGDFDKDLFYEMHRRLSACFHVECLHYDVKKKDARSWAYINFLSVGKLIVLPKLGIDEDEQVFGQIKAYYPDCVVEQLDVRDLVAAGGALNCVTWCRKVT